MDVLVSALLELDKFGPLTEEQLLVKNGLIRSRVRSLSHTAISLSRAVASSVMERRKAYLDKCSADKVPRVLENGFFANPLSRLPTLPL